MCYDKSTVCFLGKWKHPLVTASAPEPLPCADNKQRKPQMKAELSDQYGRRAKDAFITVISRSLKVNKRRHFSGWTSYHQYTIYQCLSSISSKAKQSNPKEAVWNHFHRTIQVHFFTDHLTILLELDPSKICILCLITTQSSSPALWTNYMVTSCL